MSPRLPRLTADEVIRILEQCGFVLARQSGSHRNLQKCSREENNGSLPWRKNSASKSFEKHFERR